MILRLTWFDIFNIEKDKVVYINYDNVNYFHSTDFDNNTTLYFKDGSKIVVRESSEDINKILLGESIIHKCTLR